MSCMQSKRTHQAGQGELRKAVSKLSTVTHLLSTSQGKERKVGKQYGSRRAHGTMPVCNNKVPHAQHILEDVLRKLLLVVLKSSTL